MEALPSSERMRWLVEQTASLIGACGEAQYLDAPLLEPTPAYFPDGWASDLEGGRQITRRLADHARLDELSFDIVEFVNVIEPDPDMPYRHVAGFFAGIEDGTCRFGINVPALGDPEPLAGIMAHEVAHAFRAHHGLTTAERQEEEELTDLTTVFLGSGVLIANISENGGYLPPEEIAFLLALQVVARGYDGDSMDRLGKFLKPSLRQSFREAVGELRSQEEELKQDLGVTRAASDDEPRLKPASPTTPERWTRPWGRTVYRACYRHSVKGLVLGLVLGWVAGLVTGTPALFGLLGLCGPIVGSRLGSDRCSQCRTRLEPDDHECPGCAGYIVATLRNPPHVFAVQSGRSHVRRLRKSRASHHAMWGVFMGCLAGVAASGFGVSIGGAFLTAAVGGAVGWMMGARRRRDLCSDIDCRVVLDPGVLLCPRCQAEIRSEIDSEMGRL